MCFNIDDHSYNKENLGNGHGWGTVDNNWRPIGIGKRSEIRSVVVHTTNGNKGSKLSGEASFLYNTKDVSAHYLIGKDGTIIKFLNHDCIAWHAGAVNDIDCSNLYSIGIECHFTPGENWTIDMKYALTWLIRQLKIQYPTIKKIVTHRAIAIPPGRKIDPSGWDDADFNLWKSQI